ncbi:hypothetical protein AK812_SmicGene40184 [Symbiodinium microadriaticum]|uniref:Uncharacterized protein n=1 Tax=Symbiodinium microadriaticum TaxID=2951 RepID=A0A1Q9C9E7_SYMMI|nr:hypothetical protein AK812_SmicGene40184 [Symbiodinium microadriaticum]
MMKQFRFAGTIGYLEASLPARSMGIPPMCPSPGVFVSACGFPPSLPGKETMPKFVEEGVERVGGASYEKAVEYLDLCQSTFSVEKAQNSSGSRGRIRIARGASGIPNVIVLDSSFTWSLGATTPVTSVRLRGDNLTRGILGFKVTSPAFDFELSYGTCPLSGDVKELLNLSRRTPGSSHNMATMNQDHAVAFNRACSFDDINLDDPVVGKPEDNQDATLHKPFREQLQHTKVFLMVSINAIMCVVPHKGQRWFQFECQGDVQTQVFSGFLRSIAFALMK